MEKNSVFSSEKHSDNVSNFIKIRQQQNKLVWTIDLNLNNNKLAIDQNVHSFILFFVFNTE